MASDACVTLYFHLAETHRVVVNGGVLLRSVQRSFVPFMIRFSLACASRNQDEVINEQPEMRESRAFDQLALEEDSFADLVRACGARPPG